MLRYVLLALVGVCAISGQPYSVRIEYTGTRITLTTHESNRDVTSVTFHFGVGTTNHQERGSRTATGDWVYSGQLQTNPGDEIHAYAEVHFTSGLRVTTAPAVHRVGGGPILPVGGRRIRAVTFRDDFNNYNHGSWTPEVSMFGGFNWEFQMYTNDPKNIYSKGGSLYLHPIISTVDPRFNDNFLHTGVLDMQAVFGVCTQSGNYGCHREGKNGLLPPVMSGKVSSHATVRFGTVEVRAKIPRGDWLWPAIWMMPRDSHYGGWPRSGEIDIMESRGNAGDMGVGAVSSTLHWGPSADQNRFGLTHGEKHTGSWADAFHTWRLEWTQDHIKTFIDNQQIVDVEAPNGFWAKGGFSGANIWAGGAKMAPFDQDFFIMFNVAVGGTNGFFPDNANWGVRKPWANNSPNAAGDFYNARNQWLPTWNGENAALIVDYVEFGT